MSDRCLVDTNVLVYANDIRDEKFERADDVLREVVARGAPVTTSQVASEFYKNVTAPRGRAQILTPVDAVARLHAWIDSAEWCDITLEVTTEALRAAVRFGMNIYDAQMWAVARVYDITVLVTEDLQFQAVIEGVRYVNPFADDFALADLGL